MSWRRRVLDLLRVPHEPEPPAGDSDVQVFRAAPNFLKYRYVKWALTQAGVAVGVWFGLRFSAGIIETINEAADSIGSATRLITTLIWIGEAFAVGAFVAQALGTLLLIRLDFEQRWYLISDRSIRIREGLVRLHEKTMTFANIQNVSVKQGPLQRALGIADVEVRSAGGGDKGAQDPTKNDLHVAWFHGVADADDIRELLADRMRAYRDSGLGDPDDQPPLLPAPSANPGNGVLDAAHELTREARLLRAALIT